MSSFQIVHLDPRKVLVMTHDNSWILWKYRKNQNKDNLHLIVKEVEEQWNEKVKTIIVPLWE